MDDSLCIQGKKDVYTTFHPWRRGGYHPPANVPGFKRGSILFVGATLAVARKRQDPENGTTKRKMVTKWASRLCGTHRHAQRGDRADDMYSEVT
jgi:hypothetical protein